MKHNVFLFRGRILEILALAAAVLFALVLYDAQIRNGIDIDSSTAANTISVQSTVEAARGKITDRYGRVLVSNRTVYSVRLNPESMGDYARRAETISTLLELCRKEDIVPNDGELPLERRADGYAFTREHPFLIPNEEGGTTESRFYKLCKAMNWPAVAYDPNRVAEAMLTTLGLGEDTDWQVVDILYACLLREKEVVWTSWYLAEDVPVSFITRVKEAGLQGVEIVPTAQRVYHTGYGANLLGQVGLISAENWDKGDNYKEKGYSMDATVGISGVEYAFENYLRGTSGTVERITDLDGTLLSEQYVKAPVAGNNVSLTLDIQLQGAAEESLARHTEDINGGEGGSAVVVIDVKDGGVLAAASWPTYSAADYRRDYTELAENPLKPLFNRAFLGTYAPGSTYKLVTATAALDTGLIDVDDTIECDGWIEYLDTTFRCWIYRTNGGKHGEETVSDAVRDSCNIFFYTVGKELGIKTLTEYAHKYGLGLPTGIELSEALGVNAGPEYSDRIGTNWYPGNTLSAAIGQSDNQFTPLQISNYIATLVNGGTRYAAHLMGQVKSWDNRTLQFRYEPQTEETVPLSREDRSALMTGMAEVVESTATVQEAFAGLTEQGIKVGAKTGSAQVTGQENANGLFVCFAPYDDPQVAICVAVEKGGSGAATAVIAADILENYFSAGKNPLDVTKENVLLP